MKKNMKILFSAIITIAGVFILLTQMNCPCSTAIADDSGIKNPVPAIEKISSSPEPKNAVQGTFPPRRFLFEG